MISPVSSILVADIPFSITATGTSTITLNGSATLVNYNGTAQAVYGVNYYNLELSGSGIKTLNAATTTISGTLTLDGTASATLVHALAVTGNLILGSGTTLDVSASNYALSVGGNWTNNGGTFNPRSGTVTFNDTFLSYEYFDGTAPTTFYNVIVNTQSAWGINFSGTGVSATINGTLTLTSGKIVLGSNNLTMGSAGSISGGSLTSMIVPEGTGTLTKIFLTAATTFTFPVGNLSGTAVYSPVTVTATSGSFNTCTLNLRLSPTLDPNQSPYVSHYIKRYWVLTNSGSGTPTYSITCNYAVSDVVGTESLIQNAKYSGSWSYVGFVNTGTHQVSFTGLTSFSDFTGAAPYGVKAIASLNPICPGGSSTITANVTGETSPFTYKWSTGPTTSSITITGISTATYTVTVTDASVTTRTSSLTLTVGPIIITPVVTPNMAFCSSSGAINITNSGGTAPFAYNWSTGATTQNISNLLKGTYTVTLTDIGGCSATSSSIVTQPPDPTISPDQNICLGGNTQLTVTGGTVYQWAPATGLSSTTVSNPVATPTVTTGYTVTVYAPMNQLVVNGDFSAGNTGFTSDYTYVAPGGSLVPEDTYAVGPSAHPYHSNFWGAHDHTTGSGNYMIVNGSTIANENVWKETVTTLPNTLYFFSAWIKGVNIGLVPASLRFSINGDALGPVISPATNDTVTWLEFYATWNSGSHTSAVIQIIDTVTIAGGNDFGLDDISFAQMCSTTKQVNVNVSNMHATAVPREYQMLQRRRWCCERNSNRKYWFSRLFVDQKQGKQHKISAA